MGRDHYFYKGANKQFHLCWCTKKKYKVTTNTYVHPHTSFLITADNINDAKTIAIVRFKMFPPK